ncbi:MAG: amylo-alpha-1,6-glucosidase [Polyangiales bacterium]
MLELSAEILSDLDAATRREWLVTNGLGGFASGTVSGVATRRYHGLLVAALAPPRGRHVLVSHLDETLTVGASRAALSSHAVPGVVTPDGWSLVRSFAVDPLPRWRIKACGAVLERSICMVRGSNTTLVRYTLVEGTRSALLSVRPFGAFRDFHAHAKQRSETRIEADVDPDDAGLIRWTPYDGWVTVRVRAPGVFTASPDWWKDFDHAIERERGLDDREDLFTPGAFHLSLAPGESVYVTISSEPTLPEDPAACEREEAARLRALMPEDERDPRVAMLHVAVDAYRADKAVPPALLAGYPWFEDWGRDTLIAFTGSYLVPRRFEAGREVLAAFARYVDRGMLPNRFPDGASGHADYNTVDAPVWFFHAARRYLQYTGDRAFALDVLRPALEDVARWLRRGTRYGIHIADDGLLYAGDPNTQLTWMDARVGDHTFTPRHGAPVEVNALWHSGILTLAWLAELAGDEASAKAHRDDAARTRDSFRARFWNADGAYLFDAVRDDGRDAAVRPNALYAVALPGELLDAGQRQAVIERARAELLVPFALRTLSPRDPQYRGRYAGDPWHRDGAYHQGTAWPFLIGAYTGALTRHASLSGDPSVIEGARKEVLGLFEGLTEALAAQGLGHLAEIFEGDAPHRPVGCFAQAWSDAETLRALYEDGHGRGPVDAFDEAPPRSLIRA